MIVERMKLIATLSLTVLAVGLGDSLANNATKTDYEYSRWHPAHFKPVINATNNEQCLSCHREILDRNVLEQSPAGVKAPETLAWYQTLNTYEGEQETFHRRHLVTPLAKQLMDMKCNTCHQGSDPREEAPNPPDSEKTDFTLRKSVNPDICLMCHGAHPNEIMGLPGSWPETGDAFQNNCMLCHVGIRTNRHQVNFLKPKAIEEAGATNGDLCYGCHGGRQWYLISYPYPRNSWDGMAKEIPEWAKDRPTESQDRFRIKQKQAEQ